MGQARRADQGVREGTASLDAVLIAELGREVKELRRTRTPFERGSPWPGGRALLR